MYTLFLFTRRTVGKRSSYIVNDRGLRCFSDGPKCRGRQSIKLRRRFEPQGDGLNAQLGRTFTHKKKMKKPDLPGWSHPGDMVRIHENIFDPENLASTIWFQVEW